MLYQADKQLLLVRLPGPVVEEIKLAGDPAFGLFDVELAVSPAGQVFILNGNEGIRCISIPALGAAGQT